MACQEVLALLLLLGNSFQVPGTLVTSDLEYSVVIEPHKHLSEPDLKIIFGINSHESVKEYHLTEVVDGLDNQNGGRYISFGTKHQKLRLKLEDFNGKMINGDYQHLTHCLHTAQCVQNSSIVASLSSCRGKGYIGQIVIPEDGLYYLHPIPKNVRLRLNLKVGSHFLYPLVIPSSCVDGHDKDEVQLKFLDDQEQNSRYRRQTSSPARYMEVAVGLDPYFGGGSNETYSSRIQEAIGHINGLNLLMSRTNLDPPLHIVVNRIEFFKNSPASRDVLSNLRGYNSYQRKYRDIDAAIYLTGKDLTYRGSRLVAGYGYLSGACRSTRRAVIVESNNRIVPVLAAHELGHTLGMRHDAYRGCFNCATGIMNRTLGYTNTPSSWSSSSISAYRRFLRYRRCLSTVEPSNSEEKLKILDQNCQKLTGNAKGFAFSKLGKDGCYKVFCSSPGGTTTLLNKDAEKCSIQENGETGTDSVSTTEKPTTQMTTTSRPRRRFRFRFFFG